MKIARDYYRAAGVRDSQVEPELNRDQIAELRAYAETLPYLAAFRKEFREAASMAEQGLQRREAEAAREAQQAISVSRLAAEGIVSDGSFSFLPVQLFPLAPAGTQLVPSSRMTEFTKETEQ